MSAIGLKSIKLTFFGNCEKMQPWKVSTASPYFQKIVEFIYKSTRDMKNM